MLGEIKQRTHFVRRLLVVAGIGIACIFAVMLMLVDSGLFSWAASPPNILPYQGRILNTNGVPVADPTANMQFRLFDDVAAGSCLWSNDSSTCSSNANQGVTLTSGLFSENLGDTGVGYAAIPDSVFGNNSSVFLEVEVNGEVLSPRKRVGAAAYAFNADTLDGLDSTAFLSTSTGWTLDGTPQTVTADKDMTLSGGVNGFSFDGTTFSVDATNNRIGIGTAAPLNDLHVERDANAFIGEYVVNPNAGGGAASSLYLTSSSTFAGGQYLGLFQLGPGFIPDGLWAANQSVIGGNHATAGMLFYDEGVSAPIIFATGGHQAANERLRIGTSEAVFNDNSENFDFRVETDGNANGIFVDASAETIDFVGGSGSTGCSIDASGNLTCSGTVAGGGSGFWTLDGTSQTVTADKSMTLSGGVDGLSFDGTVANTLSIDTADGFVGIGTATPGAELHVVSPDTTAIAVQASGTANETEVTISNATDGSNYGMELFGSTASGTTFGVSHAGSSFLSTALVGGGSFNIGTINPNDVAIYTGTQDQVRFSPTSGAVFNSGGLAALDFRVQTDTNTSGIFVDASAETIDLVGGSGSTGCSIDAAGNLSCSGTVSGGGGGAAFVQDGNSFGTLATLGTNDANNLTFETNNSRKVTIDTTGNVGIGTITPTVKLDVAEGNILIERTDSNDALLAMNGDDNGITWAIGNEDSVAGDFVISEGVDLDTPRLVIQSGGQTTLFGNFLPSVDDTFALGSNLQRWSDLFLGPATLHIGSLIGDEGTLSYDTSANALVVNEAGNDTDFRIEGDTNANLFFVDASTDRIGIGTAAPSFALDVVANADSAQLIELLNSSSGGSARMEVNVNDGTGSSSLGLLGTNFSGTLAGTVLVAKDSYLLMQPRAGGHSVIDATQSSDIIFANNASESMRILSSGNVGIGDSSPAALFTVGSGDLFQVSSAGVLTSTVASGNSVVIDTNTLVVDATNNRVGIGTSAPAFPLQVIADGGGINTDFNFSQAELDFVTYRGAAGQSALDLQFARGTRASPTVVSSGDNVGLVEGLGYDGSAFRHLASIKYSVDGTPGTNDMPGRIAFSTTPDGSAVEAERMRIDNAGNVGIGSTTPDALLDLEKAEDTEHLRLTDSTAGDSIGQYIGTGSPEAAVTAQLSSVYFDRSGGSMWLKTSGDNTNTGWSQMANSGSAFVQNGNSFGATATLGTNDNNILAFETNNATWMNLDTNGNLNLHGTAFSSATEQTWNLSSVTPQIAMLQGDNSDATLQLCNSNSTNCGRLGYGHSSGSGDGDIDPFDMFLINDRGFSNGGLALGVQGATVEYISHAGLVGIGDTSPDGKFDVDFSPAADQGTTDNATFFTLNTPADTAGTNTHNAVRIDGNVGNATGGTNTVNLLETDPISGDAQVSLNAINIGNLTGTAATENAIAISTGWDADIAFGDSTPVISTQNGGTLSFTDGTNSFVSIADQGTIGNVGIGTTTPDFSLDIERPAGDGNAEVSLKSASGGAASHFIATTFGGTGSSTLFLARSAGTDITTPVAVGDGFSGGTIDFQAYGDTSYGTHARIDSLTDGTQSDTNHGGSLHFYTVPNGSTTVTETLTILSTGHVGIGDADPSEATLVVGASGSGTIFATFPTVASSERLCWDQSGASVIEDCVGSPGDYAEQYGSFDATIEAGDVVAMDAQHAAAEVVTKGLKGSKAWVVKAGKPYALGVFGVVSTQPNETIGQNFTADEHPVPVALNGRVPVKISTENGDIAVGDPLTASAVHPGYAMKATEAGMIVGYALEPSSVSTSDASAKIIMFVQPGYSGAEADPTAGTSNQASALTGNLSSLNMSGNIYMAGNRIIDVDKISGLGGAWSVDSAGKFTTNGSFDVVIKSYQDEDVTTHAVLNPEHKITLDGTGTLENGTAVIRFEDIDPSFNDITSTSAPIRVSVTPNGPVSLYVSEKSKDGFTVVQLNGADSGVTFDWFVSAYRKDYEPAVIAPPDPAPPEEPPTDAPPAADPAPTDAPPAEVPVTDPAPTDAPPDAPPADAPTDTAGTPTDPAV